MPAKPKASRDRALSTRTLEQLRFGASQSLVHVFRSASFAFRLSPALARRVARWNARVAQCGIDSGAFLNTTLASRPTLSPPT